MDMLTSATCVPPGDELVELRIALVCFGGVSLAIYMHGVTKELHHLTIASAELEPGATERSDAGVVPVYRELLKVLWDREIPGQRAGVRTRFVVDVIAGTSAGGINGVCLARALAGNLSQDSLRQLWMEKAAIVDLLRPDIARRLPRVLKGARHLLEGYPGLGKLANRPVAEGGARPGPLRRVWHLLRAAPYLFRPAYDLVTNLGTLPSVLDGGKMSNLCNEALQDMPRRAAAGSAETLMPPGLPLHLFVTVTDFGGWQRAVPLARQTVRDKSHRHVMHFTNLRDTPDGVRHNDLGGAADHARMLGFSARATSSFPGAFPPVALDEYTRDAGTTGASPFPDSMVARFFRAYALEGPGARNQRFCDGGVLNNKPFDLAVAAIERQKAASEVRRRLIYIEPDPDELAAGAGAGPAAATATVASQDDATGGVLDPPRGLDPAGPACGARTQRAGCAAAGDRGAERGRDRLRGQ